jgi:hypothetical protein
VGRVQLKASNGTADSEICLTLKELAANNITTSNGGNSTAATGVLPNAPGAKAAARRGDSSNGDSNGAIMFRLVNIRFVPTKLINRPGKGGRPGNSTGGTTAPAAASAADYARIASGRGAPAGMPSDVVGALQTSPEPASYTHFKPSAAMLEFEQLVRQETISDAEAEYSTPAAATHRAVTAAGSPQEMWQQLRQKYNWMEGQVLFRSLYRPCIYNGPPACMETRG